MIIIWWEQWKLSSWNSLLTACLENISATLSSSPTFPYSTSIASTRRFFLTGYAEKDTIIQFVNVSSCDCIYIKWWNRWMLFIPSICNESKHGVTNMIISSPRSKCRSTHEPNQTRLSSTLVRIWSKSWFRWITCILLWEAPGKQFSGREYALWLQELCPNRKGATIISLRGQH